ncbi:MAG: ribosome silencing factor [Myxococcales bacterium]|nr:MAG: ribosome silencing factor [Myxococcales bacterium]
MGNIGIDKKAKDIEIIDVRGKVDYTDYIVLMSGSSDRQVNALARYIEEGSKKDLGTPCHGVEGLPKASWVLLDYGDVIVHIFHEHTRPYYDLETLWMDAKRVALKA